MRCLAEEVYAEGANDALCLLQARGARGGLNASSQDQEALRWSPAELVHIEEKAAPTLGWAIVTLILAAAGWAALVFSAWYACRGRSEGQRCSKCGALPLLLLALGLVAGGAALAVLVLQNLAGALLLGLIERFDLSFLGVKVRLGELRLNPFIGVLNATDLVIANPPGYRSDFLLKVNAVSLDIDMAPLLLSLGRRVIVDHLSLRHGRVNYERALTTSNVDDVLSRLRQGMGMVDGGDAGAWAAKVGRFRVSLHGVDIEGVRARAAFDLPHSPGMTVALADIRYADFEEETGSSAGSDIIRILLATLLKSATEAFAR